jgi:hypothetical protein
MHNAQWDARLFKAGFLILLASPEIGEPAALKFTIILDLLVLIQDKIRAKQYHNTKCTKTVPVACVTGTV